MKKKLLRIFFAFIMFFCVLPTAHIYNKEETKINAVDHTGGYIYFLKPSTWTESKVMMFIGHNDYTSVYDMTKVTNTDNLYRYTMPSWGGATYVAFANASSVWGSGNWGPSNRTNASHYTNVYNNYAFNSGSYYICVPASTSNNAGLTINYKSSASNLNLTTRANVYLSNNGSTYSSNTAAGTVSVSGYYMSNYSTASTRNAVSSTASQAYASTTLAPGSTATFKATANPGYTFIGWSTSTSETGIVSNNTTYTFKYDISYTGKTLNALFKPSTYTVSFDVNGGNAISPSSKTVTFNSPYGELPEPTHQDESYVFTGWYDAQSEGTPVTSSTTYTLTNDSTIYAHWEKLQNYTVTFSSANSNIGTITVYEDKPYSFKNNTFPTPSRTGYTFGGWYKESACINEVKVTDTITNSNHTLYAKWTPITYTITYNGINNATNIPTKTSYTVEDSFDVTAPFREYYTFLGWTGTDLNDPTDSFTIQKGSTGHKTYTANWESKVTFYVDMTGIYNNNEPDSVEDPFIHYWDSETGKGSTWKSAYMTHQEDNIYKYVINFTDDFTSFDRFIFAYTKNNETVPTKQTFDIELETPISIQNNGMEYRITYEDKPIFEESNDYYYEHKIWKINNVKILKVNNIHYIDDEENVVMNEKIYNHYSTYQSGLYFHEKEGYKLEGWYTSSTDFSDSNLFEKGYSLVDAPQDIYLYANYIEAHDYYIYVDAKDMNWKTEFFSVYKWNEYFHNHNNAWPGVTSDITPLGNGMYKVFIDASKSFDKLIFCNIENYDPNDVNNKIPQTEDIIMSPLNSYYVISPDTTTNSGGTNVQKIIYEQSLNNFLNAQKNLDYENGSAFRFAAGLQDYDDLVTEGKEFGFKFIFINGTTSYVGYWNFNPDSKFDCIRYVDELYEAGTPIEGISYNGFYVLTITDSITFNFNDYNQILVVACYRDTNGETQVIKAKEFNVVGSGENIYLYELER